MLEKVVISAPFGNYINQVGCTSTFGTFTVAYRGNLAYRIWRMMRTLRYDFRTGGWVNKLGLPNPGIFNFLIESANRAKKVNKEFTTLVKTSQQHCKQDFQIIETKTANESDHDLIVPGIISIHGFSDDDWLHLAEIVAPVKATAFELNVSCPNVNDVKSKNLQIILKEFKKIIASTDKQNKTPLFIKIPPVNYQAIVDAAIESGIYNFHACNTLPCKSGGMSGPILRQFVYGAIDFIRREITNPTIIAGGGVQSTADAKNYLNAGATNVAIGSALLNPFNLNLPQKIAKELSTNEQD